MQLRQLELFVAVAEHGSFSRGAESSLRTQSTVSQQIAALEAEIGVRLFDRSGRGVALTAGGQVLLAQARSVLAAVAALHDAMADFNGCRRVTLTVGASNVPATYLFPQLLPESARRHPGLTLQLVSSDSRMILQRLLTGEFELAVVGDCFDLADCDFTPLGEDRLSLVVGTQHQWRGRQQISVDELLRAPLLLRAGGSGSGRALESALAALGIAAEQLTVAARFGSNEAVKEAVLAGCGAAILSLSSVRREVARGELHPVSVSGLTVTRRFWLACRKGRTLSPAAAALAALIREFPNFLPEREQS